MDRVAFERLTEHDICETLREWYDHYLVEDIRGPSAMIEQVHSMPKQGVASSFKFGRHYGFLLGVLTALGIPYQTVTPQKWQKAMGCLSQTPFPGPEAMP